VIIGAVLVSSPSLFSFSSNLVAEHELVSGKFPVLL
jgi:hypothetical protein